MKSRISIKKIAELLVTSYAEVWIEIGDGELILNGTTASPPTRRCGLKCQTIGREEEMFFVTSYAEVWIEILRFPDLCNSDTVTSYAEVWIEI